MTAPTLRQLVAGASTVLAQAGVASPEVDARALAAHALGRDRLDYLVGVELPEDFAPRYAELVERRRQRVPLQHLTGRAPFRYLDLTVRPGVFVPRPETEVIAQHAIDALRQAPEEHPLAVDLCTGAGGIAIAVASEVPRSRVFAVDASPEAVELARHNAESLRVGPGRLAVSVADVRDAGLYDDLAGRVAVVVANPPYIPPDAVPLEAEVREHDPDLALYGGGADGLAVPGAVVRLAARLLRSGGTFVMEHAEVQGQAVRELVSQAGFGQVRTVADLTGRDRGVVARWS